MGIVLLQALLGAGDNKTAMVISIIMQWALFLPVAFFVGPHLGYGLLGIWIVNMAYRAIQAAILAMVWERRLWAKIKL